MQKPVNLLAELIEDAELVAVYGQRSGRLTDVELISAIGAVKKLDPPDWSDAAVLSLQSALSRAVQEIAPVLISDLRDPTWKPFDPPGPWYKQSGHLIFVAFSLILLVLTSCSSLGYNKGLSLNDEINQYLDSKSQLYISEAVNKLLDPKITGQEYSNAVLELRQITDSISLYGVRTTNYITDFEGLGRAFRELFLGPTVHIPSQVPYDICKTDEVMEVRVWLTQFRRAPVSTQPAPAGQSLALRQIAALCNENLPPSLLYGATTNSFTYQIRDVLDPWRSFYLPALFGAFGATVFYMRRVLDPSLRDLSFSRFAIRVAVGAFAGVIVTWFWAPNNELLNSFSSAGLTLFTVAFLIGFGVEVLFVLLDRLVQGAMVIARGGETRATVITPVYVSTEKPVLEAVPPTTQPPTPAPVSPITPVTPVTPITPVTPVIETTPVTPPAEPEEPAGTTTPPTSV